MIENNEFVVLSDEQSAMVVGGGPYDWFVKEVIKVAVGAIINNWGDFTKGFEEGTQAGR